MVALLSLCANAAAQIGGGGGVSLSGSTEGAKASTSAGATPPAGTAKTAATPAAATVSASTGGAAAATAAPAASVSGTTTPAPATPAAASTEPAPAGTQTSTPQTEMDAGTYSVRLRDLEHSVNELKEQIFRSKARLSLLAETVLQGVVAGAQARIVHENKMGNSYKLVKIVYALDGAPILNKADEEGDLGEREQFDVYNGSIVPGEHTLTVQLEYRGHGYGIFSYLRGYRFKVSSSHTFTAAEGKLTGLRVVGYEKGGPTAPLEDRPAVRYIERVDTPATAAEAAEGAK
jgi:hypothetical protein